MKKIFLLAALSLPLLVVAQTRTINWISIEEAEAAQKKQPRKVLMDVYTQWCGPCKMMMQNTFTNQDVIDYINKYYYAVKFDAESAPTVTFKGQTFTNPDFDPNKAGGRNGVHQLARSLGVSAYPTIVYMDEKMDIISPIPGYKGPAEIEIYLKLFAQNDYKTVTTQEQWTAYQQSFKGTFKP